VALHHHCGAARGADLLHHQASHDVGRTARRKRQDHSDRSAALRPGDPIDPVWFKIRACPCGRRRLITGVVLGITLSRRLLPTLSRRFPPPWSVDEQAACFVVKDGAGQKFGYLYYEEEPDGRVAAKLLSKDVARRIAAISVASAAASAASVVT
jgi:hypothetical protein